MVERKPLAKQSSHIQEAQWSSHGQCLLQLIPLAGGVCGCHGCSMPFPPNAPGLLEVASLTQPNDEIDAIDAVFTSHFSGSILSSVAQRPFNCAPEICYTPEICYIFQMPTFSP